ncbi:MAG TPA: PD-(D/E)XK nuclease-like domain-containing protein, partial [Streptosporangiaceae bacterium]|nr:PD-(D/E)XK nuclease-like domain-containing protein [Streptosporangiaceae bacterium]
AEHEQVQAMAAELRRHPVASALFDPEKGKPEQSLFWQDAATGVWCRARLDWLPDITARDRLIVADYKSCASASPRAIARSVASYGYHQQDPWYRDAVRALGLSDDPAFLFVFQEKDPPYLITIAELHPDTVREGRDLNREAIEVYRDCAQAGIWPGYEAEAVRAGRWTGIEQISIPPWAYRKPEEYR